MSLTIRNAEARDYTAFVRLFPELRVDDPIADEARFVGEIVPCTIFAEDPQGAALGYAYFQLIRDIAFVRHVVTAPEARRRGVGRALMQAMATRARAGACTTWCLNVKPDNASAIALYESFGMAQRFASCALRIEWTKVDGAPSPDERDVTAREVRVEDDARVETAMRLMSGQLASARELAGRVLLMLEDPAGAVLGATIFHPHFPGGYPFRVARPTLAVPLLRAIRPHARPSDAMINMVVEDQPDVAELLIALGAVVHLEAIHMVGPL